MPALCVELLKQKGNKSHAGTCRRQKQPCIPYLCVLHFTLVILYAGICCFWNLLRCAVAAELAGERVEEHEDTWWYTMDNNRGGEACMRVKISTAQNDVQIVSSTDVVDAGNSICNCDDQQGGFYVGDVLNVDFDPQDLDDCASQLAKHLEASY